MSKNLDHIADCSAYPGKYVPMPEIEELLRDKKRCMKQPAINMDEFDNFFRIEVSLPGIHRQDIVIFVEENILTVKVIHIDQGGSASKVKIHEFDVNYFERQITLPQGADAEFAVAEYREGVLHLIIPKVTDNSRYHAGKIVVY